MNDYRKDTAFDELHTFILLYVSQLKGGGKSLKMG